MVVWVAAPMDGSTVLGAGWSPYSRDALLVSSLCLSPSLSPFSPLSLSLSQSRRSFALMVSLCTWNLWTNKFLPEQFPRIKASDDHKSALGHQGVLPPRASAATCLRPGFLLQQRSSSSSLVEGTVMGDGWSPSSRVSFSPQFPSSPRLLFVHCLCARL